MRKILLLVPGYLLIAVMGFAQQDISKLKGPRPVIDLATVPENAYYKGVIDIKFDPSVAALLKTDPATVNGFISFGIPAVDALNKQYNVTQAVLSFSSLLVPTVASRPAAGQENQFTDKQKQWGFNLWYQLKFPSTVNIKEIVAKYRQLTGVIDVAEPNYKAAMISDKVDNNCSSPNSIPNDPLFVQQWNYNNTGQAGGTPGSDIHLAQAWDIETGKPNVIVAVDDGGIQVNHPDLAAHMWPGNGFNFVNNTQVIDPSEHATHTSGTVGAISNNGIGVSGIAGGDGTDSSGVRLMSMEVFGPDTINAPSFGAPFVWSADRGAAISQNSWGYETAGVYDQDVLDGIDYFIANGGGTVLKGGVVVFSAGNDNSDAPKYPAYYSKTIAVAATNNRDVRSYYSNYGTWVDICAPGGEQESATDPAGVLSTTWNSSYEFLQGTSMACPHVSGVAALIVSKAPGLLTADSVRSILLSQVDNIYPLNNVLYTGKLGTGRLDAYKCLQRTAEIVNILKLDATVSQFILPAVGVNICDSSFSPIINIINLGRDTLTSLQVGVILDGATITPLNNWKGKLPLFAIATDTLNALNSLLPGQHTLQVFSLNPNGGTDQQPSNDTATITFNIQQTISLPASQNFEPSTAPMPPVGGWNIINPDNSITWQKYIGVKGPTSSDSSCMWMNASDYPATGAIDIFTSPKIDLAGIDTIKFAFDLSYERWATSFVDTLEIVYSPDCGVTWLPTGYKKWGLDLSTVGDVVQAAPYFPTDSTDWRNDEISIPTCGIPSSNIIIGMKWTNGFGNNCFIDDITIDKVNSYQTNAAIVAIDQPPTILCAPSFTPQVTLANFGTDALTSVAINYQLDNGTINTFNWTGNLSKCATTVVTLGQVTTTDADHVLKVYTTQPNGQTDQFPANDTLIQQLDVSPLINTPVTQGFESDSFPPNNWSVLNPDGLITWTRSTAAASSGNAAMVIRNYNYTVGNTEDKFFSPVISNNASIDSMFASFDLSYAPGASYPGSTALPLDTLELQVSTDCGTTFQTIWKKWGESLQTINDPNYASTNAFTPAATQWKNINIYLTPFVGASNFQLFFVAKSNHQNNIWIDNINIYSKTLPALLKQQGYLIYPSPFVNTFEIHHWQPPVNLRDVQVFNSFGQLVWDKAFSGDAPTEIFVSLNNLAKGVYIIKMSYTDKKVVQKIVKD